MSREGCSCLPLWLKKLLLKVSTRCCLQCATPLASVPSVAQMVGYPCFSSEVRVHFVALLFCTTECGDAFHREEVKSGRAKYYDVLPCSPKTFGTLPKRQQELLRQRVRENHPYNNVFCEHCTRGEHKGLDHFKMCGGCQMVRYCSTECQRSGWKKHKLFCRAKQGDEEALKKLPSVDVAPMLKNNLPQEALDECACFTEHDKELWKRAHDPNGACCRVGCPNKCTGPVNQVSMCMTECTLIKGRLHIMPTRYCGARCQKKAMAKKE